MQNRKLLFILLLLLNVAIILVLLGLWYISI